MAHDADGNPDPLPSIEILGAEPAAESVQVVTTGPRRPRRSRMRALAVGAVLVVLLGGGLLLGDDDRPAGSERDAPDVNQPKEGTESTPTTDGVTAPTEPPTTAPVGPVFGEPVGAGLLVFGPRGWELIDLDTGTRTSPRNLPVGGLAPELGGANVYAKLTIHAVQGGLVMVIQGQTARALYYTLGPGGEVADPVDLGPADVVLSAGRSDRVWLVDRAGPVAGPGPAPPGVSVGKVQVSLVDLRGQVVRSFSLDNEPLWATVEQGMVVERAGRVYLADERGLRAVAVGHVIGAVDSDLVLVSCDDAGACAIERQPAAGGPARRLRPVADVDSQSYAIGDAGGRLALGTFSGFSPGLVVFAADGQTLATIDGPQTFSDVPIWLPGDLGFVVAADSRVQWIRPSGAEWPIAPLPPAFDDLYPSVMFLIDW